MGNGSGGLPTELEKAWWRWYDSVEKKKRGVPLAEPPPKKPKTTEEEEDWTHVEELCKALADPDPSKKTKTEEEMNDWTSEEDMYKELTRGLSGEEESNQPPL